MAHTDEAKATIGQKRKENAEVVRQQRGRAIISNGLKLYKFDKYNWAIEPVNNTLPDKIRYAPNFAAGVQMLLTMAVDKIAQNTTDLGKVLIQIDKAKQEIVQEVKLWA